jgi:O-antigen/teichoic acid export membrane protein
VIGKSKLLGNSFSVLVNRLAQSISTFILVIFIARILGPYSLGQYTLAFNYYFLFMSLSSQGFKTLFTRELSRDPEQTPIYLVSGSFLQLFISVISYAILSTLVLLLPYTAETSFYCCLLGLMIVPFSLSNITEAIFQAQEKMYFIAISTAPIYILRALIIVEAMTLNRGLLFVCLTMLFSEICILLIQWGLITKFVDPKWKIDWEFMWQTLKSARTFLAIEGAAVFNSRMLVIILSIFSGEVVVGLYGSILQLMQPFEIVAHSLVVAVFPGMTKAVQFGKEKQRYFAELVIEVLLSVALPIIIGVSFIGGEILVLVYGNPEFAQAALAFNIVAFALFVASFTRPLGYLLVANGLEKINLLEVMSTSIIGGLVGLALIPNYQLMGAALTVILMQVITSMIYIYAVYKKLFSLKFEHLLKRPLLIGIGMLITFIVLQKISPNTISTITISTLVYSILASVVYIHYIGGLSVIWTRLKGIRS